MTLFLGLVFVIGVLSGHWIVGCIAGLCVLLKACGYLGDI